MYADHYSLTFTLKPRIITGSSKTGSGSRCLRSTELYITPYLSIFPCSIVFFTENMYIQVIYIINDAITVRTGLPATKFRMEDGWWLQYSQQSSVMRSAILTWMYFKDRVFMRYFNYSASISIFRFYHLRLYLVN